MFTHTLGKPKKPSLYNKKTDWNYFKEILDEHLTLTVPLKTEIYIEEAVEDVTKAIQKAAWQATRDSNDQTYTEELPTTIKQTGRKTKSSQKMATNKGLSRKTTLQQNSERTKTPITNPKKWRYSILPPRIDAD